MRSVARIAQGDVMSCLFRSDYIQKHTTRVLLVTESFRGVVDISVGLQQGEAALEQGREDTAAHALPSPSPLDLLACPPRLPLAHSLASPSLPLSRAPRLSRSSVPLASPAHPSPSPLQLARPPRLSLARGPIIRHFSLISHLTF